MTPTTSGPTRSIAINKSHHRRRDEGDGLNILTGESITWRYT